MYPPEIGGHRADACRELLLGSAADDRVLLTGDEYFPGGMGEFDIEFDENTLNIPKEDEIIIYRIFQEFISNSLKYSGSKQIDLRIKKEKKRS